MTPPRQSLHTVALINLSSSSATDIADQMSAIFERYGYPAPLILKGYGPDMPDLLGKMKNADGDLLISFGGDGTAGAVASMAFNRNCPFLPLPGGTMNLLTQGLYGSTDWKDCLLSGLAIAAPRPMLAGRVTDNAGVSETFLVGAIFGQITRMNAAREELREGHLLEAAKGAIETLQQRKENAPLYIQTKPPSASSQKQAVELLNVLCPFMSGQALDPNTLDVTMVETLSAGTTLSLGLATLRGDLQNAAGVKTLPTREFTLTSEVSIDALIDGEPHRFEGPVTVTLERNCGQVMAPWPPLSFPSAHEVDEAVLS